MQVLDELARDTPDHRTTAGHLLYAMSLEGTGRPGDALREYVSLADKFPGEEVRYWYAALLAQTEVPDAAQENHQEIVRRVDLQGSVYRRAQRAWYDAARRTLA